ncbi:MAG: hypothetical protein WC551_12020 [Patescibacteria group bacterium]
MKASYKITLKDKELFERLRKIGAHGLKALVDSVVVKAKALIAKRKWQSPGGYGWWKERKPHGFVSDSIQTGNYAGKGSNLVLRVAEPGAFIRLSSLVYPIEYGTKKSKRGFLHTDDWKKAGKPSGPSRKHPFLRPALRNADDIVAKAIGGSSL